MFKLVGLAPNLPAYEDFGVSEWMMLAALGTSAATTGYQLANQKKPVMPPSPLMPAQQIDASAAAAQENAMRRQSIAGGINSTVGAGGQGGSVMNPSNMGGHTLLGQ